MRRLLAFSLIATLSFPLMVFADEVNLPVVKKPAILNEGTQSTLSADQIAELMPWAKDTKFFLVDLLDNIGPMSSDDKIEKLISGIKDAVGESAPKNSELLMRYILNRALVINDLILKEADLEAVGTKDVLIRTLISSVKMAIAYYDTDMANLKTPAKQSSFITFGMEYFAFLTELNKSIFDASAQYLIERTALEWFQWDLYRDLNNKMYAPQIVKINNSLKTFSLNKMSDAQAITAIRQMKKIAEQLDVVGTLNKMKEDERRIENEQKLKLLKIKEEELRIENEQKFKLLKTDEERKAAIEKERAEKLKGPRSLIESEQVIAFGRLLSNSEWTTRRSAVYSLSSIPGADVTLTLIKQLCFESDLDVAGAAYNQLWMRLNKLENKITNDVRPYFDLAIMDLVNLRYKGMDWQARRFLVIILGKIESIQIYRLLSNLSVSEKDMDVLKAITESMASLAKTIKE
ncbi:MAG: hypothetical protein KBD76_06920 [Bacteriovorax sp.]|nr:hypothetical protein [Bacteriovorax sp.]